MIQAMRYGRGEVEVDLPPGCDKVIEARIPSVIQDVGAAVRRCLERPLYGRPLAEIVRDRRRVALIIPDATRKAAMDVWLPPLLDAMRQAGAGPNRTTLVIATGKHRVPTADQVAELVGREICAEWSVLAHDADVPHVKVGSIDDRTPIAVDKRVAEADCVILAGGVSHHYLAGFGGGRKLIAPGVCGRETVEALHSWSLANIDPATGAWRSRTGELKGNPFHEAVVAAARTVHPAFAVHIIVGREGQVVEVVAGDPFKSHELACGRYDRVFRISIRRRRPLVVASCGGWPYDVNLYQAHKGLDNAFRAVAPGGTIVLLAECADGWGPPASVDWLGIESLEEHHARLKAHFEIVGHTTYALKWKATQCRVILVSEPLAERVAAGDGPAWLAAPGESEFRFEIVGSIEVAMDRAGAGDEVQGYVMPAASACLPVATE